MTMTVVNRKSDQCNKHGHKALGGCIQPCTCTHITRLVTTTYINVSMHVRECNQHDLLLHPIVCSSDCNTVLLCASEKPLRCDLILAIDDVMSLEMGKCRYFAILYLLGHKLSQNIVAIR